MAVMLAQPPASGMAFEQETAQARKTEGGASTVAWKALDAVREVASEDEKD